MLLQREPGWMTGTTLVIVCPQIFDPFLEEYRHLNISDLIDQMNIEKCLEIRRLGGGSIFAHPEAMNEQFKAIKEDILYHLVMITDIHRIVICTHRGCRFRDEKVGNAACDTDAGKSDLQPAANQLRTLLQSLPKEVNPRQKTDKIAIAGAYSRVLSPVGNEKFGKIIFECLPTVA